MKIVNRPEHTPAESPTGAAAWLEEQGYIPVDRGLPKYNKGPMRLDGTYTPLYRILEAYAAAKCAEVERECLRLKLAASPDTWWDDDNRFDSPEEYADERGLKLGDEFELTGATYTHDEKYRVTKVPDETNDDFECELVSSPKEQFETYFEMKERAESAEAKLSDVERERDAAKEALRQEINCQWDKYLESKAKENLERAESAEARLQAIKAKVEELATCIDERFGQIQAWNADRYGNHHEIPASHFDGLRAALAAIQEGMK